MSGTGSDHNFTIVGSRLIHEGVVVTSEMLDIRTPDGDMIERQVVRHPGAVAVVALHNDCLVLVKQYRAALDSELVEIPAGKRDVADEPLDVTARRELIEEVGLDPQSLTHLGTFVTAAGFCDEHLAIFFSDDCLEVEQELDGPEELHSQVLHIPVTEIGDWLLDGRLVDAKSLIGIYWARDRGLLPAG